MKWNNFILGFMFLLLFDLYSNNLKSQYLVSFGIFGTYHENSKRFTMISNPIIPSVTFTNYSYARKFGYQLSYLESRSRYFKMSEEDLQPNGTILSNYNNSINFDVLYKLRNEALRMNPLIGFSLRLSALAVTKKGIDDYGYYLSLFNSGLNYGLNLSYSLRSRLTVNSKFRCAYYPFSGIQIQQFNVDFGLGYLFGKANF